MTTDIFNMIQLNIISSSSSIEKTFRVLQVLFQRLMRVPVVTHRFRIRDRWKNRSSAHDNR